jgi:hypothetical protein
MGEDGIFGLPGWAWRADPVTPHVVPAPRYFRWWVGGPASKLIR